MISLFDDHPRLGILSLVAKIGEKKYYFKGKKLYFWYILNNAYFLRKEFILDICKPNKLDYMNFLYDGTNFRGYGSESELIAKGFINDWAAGITSEVIHRQNRSYILNAADLIKTDPLELN